MKSKATLMLMATTLLSSFLMAEGVSRQARSDRDRWMKKWLTGSKSKPVPFSFKDNEDSGVEMLKEWPRKASRRQLDAFRTERTIRWADPQTGLEVRCVAVEYSDFPAVEWTIYFKNAGAKDSSILSEIQALDITLPRKTKENVDLHYIEGDGTPSAYAPRLKPIGAGAEMHFSPVGGRPTSGAFPYYNLEWRDQGVIIAVGWSGQWASSFSRDRVGVLHIRAGQERTHLKLHSGEEVRSPMIVQLFWHGGDWISAQNLWRRWMRAHNMPQPGGKNVSPILAAGTAGLGLPNYSIELDNEKDQEYFIAKYTDEKLNLNYWWMDIYIASTNFWWKEDIYGPSGFYLVRDWEVDRKLFPNGLQAISEFAKSKGMGTLAWYEPEHVWPGYKLYDDHPDWLLSAPSDAAVRKAINQGQPLGNRRVLNLGNREVVNWLIDHFSRTLKKEELSVYRQDFNIEPLVFWRYSDPPDRQGMTENLYVQGYLRYWDGLLQRGPDLLIDSCASGGRRNDIETLRRALPLWRSDDSSSPRIEQNHTYGLALWIPYFGTGLTRTDSYAARSALGSSLVTSWDLRDQGLDYDNLRKLTTEFWRVAAYYIGDYYPLTAFSSVSDDWMAWQFDRPDQDDGIVQAFYREENNSQAKAAKNFLLRGLDPAARYEVTDIGVGPPKIISGKDLMQLGIAVEFRTTPAAALITYKKVRGGH